MGGVEPVPYHPESSSSSAPTQQPGTVLLPVPSPSDIPPVQTKGDVASPYEAR